VIHASPPCQHYANVTRWRGSQDGHPDLIGVTVAALRATGLPWVVENVPEAPIEPHFLLCGSMFGLAVRRHRAFLTSWNGWDLLPWCDHSSLLPFEHKGERAYADAMGCGWMTNREAREAIPPAYTEWIGRQLMAALLGETSAALNAGLLDIHTDPHIHTDDEYAQESKE
jgi:DNA (cytosine-5)-methyltransferase 1